MGNQLSSQKYPAMQASFYNGHLKFVSSDHWTWWCCEVKLECINKILLYNYHGENNKNNISYMLATTCNALLKELKESLAHKLFCIIAAMSLW